MSGFQKIIYLVRVPLSRFDYDRFGLQRFTKRGFLVEVWDCSSFLNPRYYNSDVDNNGLDYVLRKIESPEMLESICAEVRSSETIAINFIPYGLKSIILFQLLRKYSIRQVKYVGAHYATSKLGGATASFLSRVYNFVKRNSVIITPGQIGDAVVRLVPPSFFRAADYDCIFVNGGQLAVDAAMRESKKLVVGHQSDYDTYLNQIDRPSCEKGHIVFLDEYVPLHPDHEVLGIRCEIEFNEYYSQMRDFFDQLESLTQASVVIAAHPRSEYEHHPGVFGNRSVIKGETLRLVRESSFVVTHYSNSVLFAVMCRKPITFFSPLCFHGLFYSEYTNAAARNFGKTAISSIPPDPDFFYDIDLSVYSSFFAKYIKIPGTSEKCSWDIFIDEYVGAVLPTS